MMMLTTSHTQHAHGYAVECACVSVCASRPGEGSTSLLLLADVVDVVDDDVGDMVMLAHRLREEEEKEGRDEDGRKSSPMISMAETHTLLVCEEDILNTQ